MLTKSLSRIGVLLLVGAMASGAALAQEKVIKIGSQISLTGNLARVGNTTLDGIKVAVEEANEKYKGKYKFELAVVDDETSPAKAVAAVEKLASDGVVALSGGYGTNIVGPASGAAHDLHIPYITSGALGNELTARGYNDYFQIVSLAGYSKAIVGYIEAVRKEVKVDVASIVHLENESNTDIAKMVAAALERDGVKVHLHGFAAGGGNYTALLNRVRLQDKPDVLFIAGYENEYVGVLRAAKLTKLNIQAAVGAWSLATEKMNKEFNDLMQGIAGPTMLPFPAEFKTDNAQHFADLFKKVHGHLPDYLGLYGYVQTQLMIDAITRAADTGELNGARITSEMHKTDAQTPLGQVKFAASGINEAFVQNIGQHQGDTVQIVWPESAATAKIKLPGRSW